MTNEENKQKAVEAIGLISNAESESQILDAVSVKGSVNWEGLEDLEDDWNDCYGDADRRYLP